MSASLEIAASASSQPPLMGNVDPTKVDEIRRTVYVGNLNSQVTRCWICGGQQRPRVKAQLTEGAPDSFCLQTTTAEQLLDFFRQVGSVKFVRMAGDETQPTRFAFVEFSEQDSVARALTFNGVMFGDRPLKSVLNLEGSNLPRSIDSLWVKWNVCFRINHSNNAIVKPPEMTPQAAAKELESVMKRVREAQSTIAAAIEPGMELNDVVEHRNNACFVRSVAEAVLPSSVGPKRRSSSRSRRPRRSRSCSRSTLRKKRSHSKHRYTDKSVLFLISLSSEVHSFNDSVQVCAWPPQFPAWPQEALSLQRQETQSEPHEVRQTRADVWKKPLDHISAWEMRGNT